MKTKRNPLIYVKTLCFFLLSLVILFPVLYSFANSFMGQEEITEAYSGILGVGADVGFHMFPEHFTLEAYGNVMLDTPEYWLKFWKSLGMAGLIAIGQLLIGGMCGMAFAKYHFPGWKIFFFLFVIFLLLPVQVTLFPNFLVLSWLKLAGTWWALILPGIFSPFGVFLMTLIFQNVPTEILEAARLDGAGTLRIFANMMLPVYRLDRPLFWKDVLTVRTWHRGSKGASMYRDFDLFREGEPVGEAVSVWVLADFTTHRLCRLETLQELD